MPYVDGAEFLSAGEMKPIQQAGWERQSPAVLATSHNVAFGKCFASQLRHCESGCGLL